MHALIPRRGRQPGRLRRRRRRQGRRFVRFRARPRRIQRPHLERVNRPVRQARHRVAHRRGRAARNVRPVPVIALPRLLPVLVLGDGRIARIRPRQIRLPVLAERRQPRRLGRRRRRRGRSLARPVAVARRVHRPDPEPVLRPVLQARRRITRRRRAAARHRRPVPELPLPFLLPVLVLRDRGVLRIRPRQFHAPVLADRRQARRLRRRRHRRRRRFIRLRPGAGRIQRPDLERVRRPVLQARHRMARRRRIAARHRLP